VPKHRLLVSLSPAAPPAERLRLVNALRAAIDSPLVAVQDTAALLAGTDVAVVGLQAFFDVVAALCLVLCFFATALTFSANVRESASEFGVLRALGLSGADAARAAVYEALAVTLAGLGQGVAIGLAIAVALTLQFGLFTELPFTLVLPGGLLALFVAGVAALAVAAAAVPAGELRARPIAAVLKGA
jgi:ABC-type antimicrobial peptide transport system permease subunit